MSKMLRLMASGEPVELTSPMASVRKLARLAYVAEQFGYQYVHAKSGGGAENKGIKMFIVPDTSPQARQRAAENWARYPQAGDGESLPPYDEQTLELLKARIKFDLASNYTVLAGVGGVTVACVLLVVENMGETWALVTAAALWVFGMALAAAMMPFHRKRMRRLAALLTAAGFVQIHDEKGRERYVRPEALTAQAGGNPFAQPQAGGNPFAHPQGGGNPYGGQPQQQPYAQPQQAPGTPYPYPGAQPQPQPQQPGYGSPQPDPNPYGAQPQGMPAPNPNPPYPPQYPQPQPQSQQPQSAPYAPQQPQNPYGNQGYGRPPYGGQ